MFRVDFACWLDNQLDLTLFKRKIRNADKHIERVEKELDVLLRPADIDFELNKSLEDDIKRIIATPLIKTFKDDESSLFRQVKKQLSKPQQGQAKPQGTIPSNEINDQEEQDENWVDLDTKVKLELPDSRKSTNTFRKPSSLLAPTDSFDDITMDDDLELSDRRMKFDIASSRWVGNEEDELSEFDDIPDLPSESKKAVPLSVDEETYFTIDKGLRDEFQRHQREFEASLTGIVE